MTSSNKVQKRKRNNGYKNFELSKIEIKENCAICSVFEKRETGQQIMIRQFRQSLC